MTKVVVTKGKPVISNHKCKEEVSPCHLLTHDSTDDNGSLKKNTNKKSTSFILCITSANIGIDDNYPSDSKVDYVIPYPGCWVYVKLYKNSPVLKIGDLISYGATDGTVKKQSGTETIIGISLEKTVIDANNEQNILIEVR